VGLHDRWYENTIIYCLDVETYADSDGDGIGDFVGLTRRLDYLASLGISCLWLMPFYPTPNRDDGYDVADYNAIDPRLGTMADFAEFMVEARERGLHVIIDLVPNHSSDQHPWFQAARREPESKYRGYYIWRDDDPGDTSDKAVFPGYQDGIWTYDEEAGAWYLHHFYDFQPDLNFSNPDVRDEFRKTMGLWLQLGVSGFRVDAAPFLISLTGVDGGAGLEPAHDWLAELREFATIRSGNAALVGEVNVGLSKLADYFGGGNELHALYNFPINRAIFLSLAQETSNAITYWLTQLPSIPDSGQWVTFLRKHDELNLSQLPKDQQEQIFAAFGPEPSMQIYNRGIRRRVAPMLGGDQARIRLAFSVMFSLPGAPMIYYGDEIGMGENLSLPERLSVRTPMQWTSGPNGGFSTADRKDLVRPMVPGGDYGFETVSVSRQRGDHGSLLNWVASLTRTRRECAEIGTGTWSTVDVGNDAVLCMRYDTASRSTIILNNLSPGQRKVTLDLSDDECMTATDLFRDRLYDPITPDNQSFMISGNGYRWIRLMGVY
jgi:maltose alpha-D-glucosyltransferase/alpha-amylase